MKNWWMAASLLVNLGLLAYFKYANFFIESWIKQGAMGPARLAQGDSPSRHASTPSKLSYSIDIYRGTLKNAASSILPFVSFFPQLVADPSNVPRGCCPK